MRALSLLVLGSFLLASACVSAPVPRIGSELVSTSAANRATLSRELSRSGLRSELLGEILPPFRVWPRALSGSEPREWGSTLLGLEYIDAPIGTGLATRMQFHKTGSLLIRMRGLTGYRLYVTCSIEPSITNQSPETLGLVRWQAVMNAGGAQRGSFSRDPLSNYWAFATPGEADGTLQEINVQISSPNDDASGQFDSWAIGFCDVLPFKYQAGA